VSFSGRTRRLYSFATKYCGWHQPDHYQIYDSRVDWILRQYRTAFSFATFKDKDLADYSEFVRVIQSLVDRFKLQQFTRKQLDKFLWIEAERLRPPDRA
jgi:hypothetical protein